MPIKLFRGLFLLILSAALIALFLFSDLLPTWGSLRAIVQGVAPWLGWLTVLYALLSLLRLSVLGFLGALSAAIVWAIQFGWAVLPQSSSAPPVLSVASHNILFDNPTLPKTLKGIVDAKADVLSLQEITEKDRPEVISTLAAEYPYRALFGTTGLWSRYPLSDITPLKLHLSWTRAGRADLVLPNGDRVRVYAVHADSVFPGLDSSRDQMLEDLGREVDKDPSPRIVVLGDLNAASSDASFRELLKNRLSDLHTPRFGFDFTWPQQFPLVQIDHVLVRGFSAVTGRVLPALGSDHKGLFFELASKPDS